MIWEGEIFRNAAESVMRARMSLPLPWAAWQKPATNTYLFSPSRFSY